MKTYRVAVIGRTGKGDYGHGLDTVWLTAAGTELVAVADDDKAGLAEAAKRLNVSQTYSDYREMLDKVKPDIVAIAPRWIDRHHEMCIAAAERGIHMYMEKPFCRTLKEADDIVRACESTHTKLAIAHQTRYSPRLKKVSELIAEGKIGSPIEYRGRGKEDARGGGEDLWVLGSHIMDMLRYLAGDPEWCFASVTQSRHPITRSDVVEGNEGIGPLAGDAVRAMYGMSLGVTASFQSYRGLAGKSSRFGIQIYGSAGILEIATGYLPNVQYLDDPGWCPGRSNAAWQSVSSAGIGLPEPITNEKEFGGNHAAVADLIEAIEEDRQPLCGMYDARKAIEMIIACYASAKTNAAVTFPLAERDNPLLTI